VWNNGYDGAVDIAIRDTHNTTGRVFAAIPRSNSQTSPRAGCIVVLV
jgi:hypothetical protein